MIGAFSAFAITIVVMAALCGLGVLVGTLNAKAKERKFLRVVQEELRGE